MCPALLVTGCLLYSEENFISDYPEAEPLLFRKKSRELQRVTNRVSR